MSFLQSPGRFCLSAAIYSIWMCILACSSVKAQDSLLNARAGACIYTLSGRIMDTDTGEPLAFATLYIASIGKGAVCELDGTYHLDSLCAGKYELSVNHIECEPRRLKLAITGNQTLNLNLPHAAYVLREAIVTGHKAAQDTATAGQLMTKVTGDAIDIKRGLSLGEALKSLPGMNSIQTGPGISKPVIHGLHSNRVLILNNGVRQEGQQWGTEHAPEIDPFIASEISVIKGAASLKYGSDAIGGVILLEPKPLPQKSGVGGELNLVGACNNRMGVISGMLEGALGKKLSGISWRLQGTLKSAGNARAPGYYLDNTGIREADYSAALNYTRQNYGAELYYSEFSTKIGILTASHIGNANDLYQAILASTPLEKNQFSYKIGRPYQDINHTLLKAVGYLDLPGKGKVELTYARQQDSRLEYSPDISYNNALINKPELAFNLVTHTLDLHWHHHTFRDISGTIGSSAMTQGNIFGGTDYFSVIPNFRNYGGGIYDIEKWSYKKLSLEGGLRYDYRWLQVYMYDYTPVIHLVEPIRKYANLTSSLGATYMLRDNLSLYASYGTAWRAPSASELYGQGVHVSAASFERGDSNLKVERAYNFTLALKYQGKRFNAELGIYNNIINSFIYQKPDLKPVVLISGTYPGFSYTQGNVVFKGIDLDLSYKIISSITVSSKTTIVRAYNFTQSDYLIFTPANRYENGLRYNAGTRGKLSDMFAGLSVLYVAHQDRTPQNADYAAPPAAYTLLNAELGMKLNIGSRKVSLSLSGYNLANKSYRDYLDRLRYFSNEPGRNVTIRIKIPF